MAFDLPAVVERAARVAAAIGVAPRVEVRAGDARSADFGVEEFDLVLFGRILYLLDAAGVASMLRRALRPGGRLVVSAFMPDDDRESDEWALLAALHLFTFHEGAEAYTEQEYRELLHGAGFGEVRRHGETLLCARR